MYPVVPDLLRLLSADLGSQKRRLDVDHRLPVGPRRVPGVP